ncbi:Uncharacterised protein r2_g1947 [Pycnogonum litorale]
MGFLLYLTIGAFLPFISSNTLEQECVQVIRARFRCDCDMHNEMAFKIKGRSTYSRSYKGVPTIKPMYDKLDQTAADEPGSYFTVDIENSELRNIRAPLFPSNITAISVRLYLNKLATIPINVFENQENNLRVVKLYTPLISACPPAVLDCLTKMTILSLNSSANMMLNSFVNLSNKNMTQLSVVSSANITFGSSALESLTSLRFLTLSSKWIDSKALLRSLPKSLSQLIYLRIT